MTTIELSDKQLGFIVLALEAYIEVLLRNEEDAGPSGMDALFVEHLAAKLRKHLPDYSAPQTTPDRPGRKE
jgi:hypothetical protein